jgi:transposase
MEAVYPKSQGLLHKEICRLSRISENSLRRYLRQVQEGGIERLKRLVFAQPRSELTDHREALEDHFRKNPPCSTAQAAADIERLTGIRRGETQVGKFLTGMGMKCRKLGMIPAKADADEQCQFLDERLWLRLGQAQGCGEWSASLMPPTSCMGHSWATSGASSSS